YARRQSRTASRPGPEPGADARVRRLRGRGVPAPARLPGGPRTGSGRPVADGRLHGGGDRCPPPLRTAVRQAQAAADPGPPGEGGHAVSADSLPDQEALPLSLARRVEQVCNQFEAAWRTGTPPRIEDFLGGWCAPDRLALLRELVPLEVYYRCRRGEDCRP